MIGRRADLTVVQTKAQKVTAERGGCWQYRNIFVESWLEGRNVGEKKGARAAGTTAALKGLSSKADSRTRGSHHAQTWPGNGLKVSCSLCPATLEPGTKAIFSDKSKLKFAFHMEIKVPESEGRASSHRIQAA